MWFKQNFKRILRMFTCAVNIIVESQQRHQHQLVSLSPTCCIIMLFMNKTNIFFMLLITNHLDIYLQPLWFWYINHPNEKYKNKKRIKTKWKYHILLMWKKHVRFFIIIVSLNKYPYILRFQFCRFCFILSQKHDIINFMNVNMPAEDRSLNLLFL